MGSAERTFWDPSVREGPWGFLCFMPRAWAATTHSPAEDPRSLSLEQHPQQGLRPGQVGCSELVARAAKQQFYPQDTLTWPLKREGWLG